MEEQNTRRMSILLRVTAVEVGMVLDRPTQPASISLSLRHVPAASPEFALVSAEYLHRL